MLSREFDWLWVNSREITTKGAALIPDLVLPEGREEGARQWQAYIHDCINAALPEDLRDVVAHVDPVTGDVKIRSEDGQEVAPPTEALGLAKLDQFAEQMARLYDKGALVSIDKLSRIPPLDAPLNPSLFGDASELHKGNVTRKVSMRVSIIDEKTLKEIDKRRPGISPFRPGINHASLGRGRVTALRKVTNSPRRYVDERGMPTREITARD